MITDEQLRIDILDELKSVPSLSGCQIEVDVRMGLVSMTGHVGCIDERIAADGAAARIVGLDRIAGGVSIQRRRASARADRIGAVTAPGE